MTELIGIFLLWILKQKGFGDKWIRWIKGCLDHPHFSILINGTLKSFFDSFRGIKQGDPFSSFLFTLVADGLSELMERAKVRGIIEGYSVGNHGFSINHLQFADDTMCCLKAKESQVSNMKNILCIFYLISRLKVN